MFGRERKTVTTAAELRTEATKLLADYGAVPADKLTDGLRLEEDLGMDSLDMVELAIDLERLADKDISDDVVASWRTVGDLYASLTKILP